MIKLEVLKGIVGDKKSIKLGGSEWEAIVKLVDNDHAGFNFLSGEDLGEDSIFDLLFELGVKVIFD
jgi:hypothetical protein